MCEKNMSVYEEHGYCDREHYLSSLADEYDISVDTVHSLAALLGKSEDFDGLVNALEDMQEGY